MSLSHMHAPSLSARPPLSKISKKARNPRVRTTECTQADLCPPLLRSTLQQGPVGVHRSRLCRRTARLRRPPHKRLGNQRVCIPEGQLGLSPLPWGAPPAP